MSAFPTEQILGIGFFNGSVEEAVATMCASGGLLVAPSGTCFRRIQEDADYRRGVTTADVVIADSGFMVLLWKALRRRTVRRISGLACLKQLLRVREREARSAFWILPHERARDRLLRWSAEQRLPVAAEDCYIAPMYRRNVSDPAFLELVKSRKPQDLIVGIGAGPQEKLGWYLREHTSYRPAIYCIGGALGFITGDQVAIPDWADRLYLGWLLRLLAQPRVFIPRLANGRFLPLLMLRYGSELPPMRE